MIINETLIKFDEPNEIEQLIIHQPQPHMLIRMVKCIEI